MKYRRNSGISSLILSVFLILIFTLIGFWAWENRQEISDNIASRAFTPSTEVSRILERLKLTDKGEKIFLATSPQVLENEEFNAECQNRSEKTAILGCYKLDKVFIFDVENNELDGVKEVTAAHELLHAVWYRMSQSEKARIGEILLSEYQRLKTEKFENLMKDYEVTQPGEEINELHSIIGTEYLDIDPELEKHYAEIFENRKDIVRLSQAYKLKFETLENEAKQLKADLSNLKNEIEFESKNYSVEVSKLESDIEIFNYRAENSYFISQDEFQAARNLLLNRQQYLNSYADQINSKVEQYLRKAEELENISRQVQTLYDDLDSSKIQKIETNLSL